MAAAVSRFIKDARCNVSYVVATDASGRATQIDATVDGVTYRRTLTWGTDDITISTWSVV